MFLVPFYRCCHHLLRCRCANTFQLSGKTLQVISSNHTWLTYGCGKNFWHPSQWPWVKATKLPKWDAIYLVPTIKQEPLIQLLQNLVGIPLIVRSIWLNFEEILFYKFFTNFICKILNPFSLVEHSICHSLGMVGPIDKGIKNGCPCIVEIRGMQGCALVGDPARAVGSCRDVAKAQP